MILADTGVWIDHFRSSDPRLEKELASGRILMHPWIVAELSLGSLRDRKKTLAQLDALLQVKVAQLSEVREMVEAHSLHAKGIGLTDAQLAASCLLTPTTQLWTRDKALGSVATALGIRAKLA